MQKYAQKKYIVIGFLLLFGIFSLLLGETLKNSTVFVYELLFKKDIELKRENGNLNILLLGIGGDTHDGPELTDTIIFANINIEQEKISLFSIPRDLWIPELGQKINTAYAHGQTSEKKGLFFTSAVVEKVVGKEVHYSIVIDFSGFEKLIDLLGGIEVIVERSFDDFQYPIRGREEDLCGHTEEEVPFLATASGELEAFPCRYEHIHFGKGTQHMDGATALEFVRSRHAQGAEGTDFARSQRQQKVILAVQKKVLSLGILLNPVKAMGVFNLVRDHVYTNVTSSEYDDFVKLTRKMEKAKIQSYVIQYADDQKQEYGLLTNPMPSPEYKFQWVLIPRRGNGDFSEIHEYIRCIEEGNICSVGASGIIQKKQITPQTSVN